MPSVTVPEPGADPEPTGPRPAEPLPARTVGAVALVIALLTGGGLVALLWWVSLTGLTGAELTNARFDAIRIGLSIAVGGGGVFALFLAWRRQRSTEADHLQRERTLEHQQQVAIDNSHDALERRITELYTKSAELLGSDKAAVRLAGIYALERLGQNNPGQRQAVFNVLCAYLRTPGDLDDQERQVRSTTQRVLTNHLHTRSPLSTKAFWPGIELDLTGTTLLNFDFSWCAVQHATFDQAEFRGTASFAGSRFESGVSFHGARFGGWTAFNQAHLTQARFNGAQFETVTEFDSTEFPGGAAFNRTRFAGLASFNRAKFSRADFTNTEFGGATFFQAADFTGTADFTDTRFAHSAAFNDAKFHALANLTKIVFADSAAFIDVEFLDIATFHHTDFQGRAVFDGSVFHRRTDFTYATFGGRADFGHVQFLDRVEVHRVRARLDIRKEDVHRVWPNTWELLEPKPPDDGRIPTHEGIWGTVLDTTMFGGDKQ